MQTPSSPGRADLRIHPSEDGLSTRTPMRIYRALLASDLDVAVLTDHDQISVAMALGARSLDGEARVRLVVGEEITTRQGHLLGLGLTRVVPADMPMGDSIAAVHDQGGIAVIAHPLVGHRAAAPADLLRDLSQEDGPRRPDAVEAMHPTAAWFQGWRSRVEELAQSSGYALVGGSDAHSARLVGRGWTSFDGNTWADLVTAIGGRATHGEGRRATIRDLLGRRIDQLAG